MNKKQQIRDIGCNIMKGFKKLVCFDSEDYDIIDMCIADGAEALYNAGYRKIENGNGHNLPHEIEYLLTEFDEMGFAPTNVCDNPERKAKLWKSALVYELGLLLDEYAEIKQKAVEEFAEKCKERINADYVNGMLNNHRGHLTEYDIDELIKEFEK